MREIDERVDLFFFIKPMKLPLPLIGHS